MRVFTVHVPPADASGGAGPVLIPEGFSWACFLLAPLWLLWQRLWLPLAGWVVLTVALVAARWAWAGWVMLAAQLLLAYHAADLRRWRLGRRGWAQAGVVVAPDPDSGFARFAAAEPALAARGAP